MAFVVDENEVIETTHLYAITSMASHKSRDFGAKSSSTSYGFFWGEQK